MSEDYKNFSVQAAKELPILKSFFDDFDNDITRPNDMDSSGHNEEVDHVYITYTVVGQCLKCEYKIDI